MRRNKAAAPPSTVRPWQSNASKLAVRALHRKASASQPSSSASHNRAAASGRRSSTQPDAAKEVHAYSRFFHASAETNHASCLPRSRNAAARASSPRNAAHNVVEARTRGNPLSGYACRAFPCLPCIPVDRGKNVYVSFIHPRGTDTQIDLWKFLV